MKFICKIGGALLTTLFLIGAAVQSAPIARRVYAQTTEMLQAQVDELRAKIALVQAQLGMNQSVSAAIPATFRFERTLRSGVRGADVRYLQILLNRDPDTRVNAPGLLGGTGNETDYFGGATKLAVIRFQNKYAVDMLRPAGLARGTGLVGALTRNKLNTLLTALQVAVMPAAPVIPPALPAPSGTAIPASPTPAGPAAPTVSFDEINLKTRAALANILCTTRRGGSFNPISGSGVFVDPHGVILTNAHVGQYLLLKDYLTPDFLECTIRTGEPSRNRYKAILLFVSPDWVRDNASKLSENEPTGTGENDFALLLVTESTDPSNPLPSAFPFVPMDFSNTYIRTNTEVLAAAYPAGFLGGINIQKDLYPSSSVVTTGTVFSFGEKNPDIFSIGGSVLAQHGSSGGAVVSPEAKLIGLIVTSSTGGTTGERNLNALTMSHVAESYARQSGESLQSLFASDLRAKAEKFNADVFPRLKKLLEDALLPK